MATLRRSEFIHLLPLADNRTLVVHAITHLRWTIDAELAALIAFFNKPRLASRALPALQRQFGYDKATLRRCIAGLVERRVLSDRTRDSELQEILTVLGPGHGRDPEALLEQYRRAQREGVDPYWSVTSTERIEALGAATAHRIDVLLFGDCELQMEADFLRRTGLRRALDVRVAATFPGDARFASEHAHQLVIVGALRSRHTLMEEGTDVPHGAYIAEATQILRELREHTQAPILLDNLPEPTVQPLGFGDQGPRGHRNRFRQANLALAEAVQKFADVHIVDMAAALAARGSQSILDDGLVSFTHFGSAGWMLQRPEGEKTAVHNLFPDMAPLAAAVQGNPYGREEIAAVAHLDAIRSVLSIDAKKCVIVDLDGVLWPGVLAETGAPFAWRPESSGEFSYVGLYFGIHEALRALQKRGIILACVSKNDEETVRNLWHFPDHYPHNRLLTLDSFVTHRINWQDKATNIQSIAEELGLATNTFVFIDDHPVERERVRVTLPDVALLGEDLFALRRVLLTDPRLQPARLTAEAGMRTDLVKAQLSVAKARAAAMSEDDFIASLQVQCTIDRLRPGASVDRIVELFQRTTQFNTTGRKVSAGELTALCARDNAHIFALRVRDRITDHGLVGAAIVVDDEVIAFAMSCRVLGLGGVEHSLMQALVSAVEPTHAHLRGQIIETDRNQPVRHLYADNGFVRGDDGWWTLALPRKPAKPGKRRLAKVKEK